MCNIDESENLGMYKYTQKIYSLDNLCDWINLTKQVS